MWEPRHGHCHRLTQLPTPRRSIYYLIFHQAATELAAADDWIAAESITPTRGSWEFERQLRETQAKAKAKASNPPSNSTLTPTTPPTLALALILTSTLYPYPTPSPNLNLSPNPDPNPDQAEAHMGPTLPVGVSPGAERILRLGLFSKVLHVHCMFTACALYCALPCVLQPRPIHLGHLSRRERRDVYTLNV